MEKITISNVVEISESVAKSKGSFFVNPFYLLDNCYYEEKNGEFLLTQPSVFRKDELNLINVVKSVGNLDKKAFTLLFDDEITRLESLGLRIADKKEVGIEFFYKTSDFAELEGHEFKSCRKKINQLNKKYQVKVFTSYDRNKVVDFINEWAEQKHTSDMGERELKSFKNEVSGSIGALDLLDKIPSKSYFVEIGGSLVGFRITVPLSEELWVGVFQKVNHNFKGLNEFIYHISAKDYLDIPWFTTGAAGGNKGLDEHKRKMHPRKEKNLYFVLTEKT